MKKIFGIRYKTKTNYYEKHHIIPHSLNGSDEKKNLVLLTAKEHYLCHWLLVKRFDKDTIERKKMIKAWFMMAATGDTNRPKINMNTYAKYKNELGKIMSEQQTIKNSQLGKHWFTNRDTGESKPYIEPPNEKWIEGRNLFKQESSFIPYMKSFIISKGIKKWHEEHTNIVYKKKQLVIFKKKTAYNIYTFEKIKVNENKIPKDFTLDKNFAFHNSEKIKTKKLWDEFNNSSFNSLNEFAKYKKITQPLLTSKFIVYIPIYKRISQKRFRLKPNKNLIGIYE